MNQQTSSLPGRYAGPTSPESRLAGAVENLNQVLRDLHEAGRVVLVAEDHICERTFVTPLPQVRVEVRTRNDAVDREDVLDG